MLVPDMVHHPGSPARDMAPADSTDKMLPFPVESAYMLHHMRERFKSVIGLGLKRGGTSRLYAWDKAWPFDGVVRVVGHDVFHESVVCKIWDDEVA